MTQVSEVSSSVFTYIHSVPVGVLCFVRPGFADNNIARTHITSPNTAYPISHGVPEYGQALLLLRGARASAAKEGQADVPPGGARACFGLNQSLDVVVIEVKGRLV